MAPYRELRTNLYLHDNLRQKSKNIQWRKDSFFDKWCWGNWTPTYERIKTFSQSIYKNKLKNKP